MKKLVLAFTVIFSLILVNLALAEDGEIEDFKKEFKRAIGKSVLFKVTSGTYDKKPSKAGGMNIYIMNLKAKGKLGEGLFTFKKNPETGSKGLSESKPEYRTLTLKIYTPPKMGKDIPKEVEIPLHMKEDATLAVYKNQNIAVTWLGDGQFGMKGFHLYSYSEKLTK